MKHLQTFRSFFWLLPFICFITGYWMLSRLYPLQSTTTPNLVGKNLQEAVAHLTSMNINPRLMAEKEDAELPAGTILNQTPAPGQKIKPQQSVMLVVSKKPKKISMPTLISKTKREIDALARQLGLHHKSFTLPSAYPQEQCFAQWPLAGKSVEQSTIITYNAAPNKKMVIFPNLKEQLVTDVVEFLQPYAITTEIIHSYPQKQGHLCSSCKVVDQRPLPGSIITLDREKPLIIQLQVL